MLICSGREDVLNRRDTYYNKYTYYYTQCNTYIRTELTILLPKLLMVMIPYITQVGFRFVMFWKNPPIIDLN